MVEISLPCPDGSSARYRLAPPSPFPQTATPNGIRTVYAAAHVVADPLKLVDPWREPAVDWDATLAFRRHLWGLGFKIAEAMDTSQRGMGLDWQNAAELITRVLAEAKATPGADLACGAGTDQLAPHEAHSLDDVIRAYEEQIGHIEEHGGKIILITDAKGAAQAGIKTMETIILPEVPEIISPIIYALPIQMLAYFTAVFMGTDVDQPRNLAKSVTVE